MKKNLHFKVSWKHAILVLPLFLFITSFSQSLSPERVAKIKSATASVITDGGISIGTAFFIDNKGTSITCWHVVLAAMQAKRNIFLELNDGTLISVGLPNAFNNDTVYDRERVAYDFCILIPMTISNRIFSFLKLGDYSKAVEGEEVYTCGYPLGYKQQFISKGIISTKYQRNPNEVTQLGIKYNYPREEALLDLTLNRGNSGGAIIKIGKTIADDAVIGIADFIINPLGSNADTIIKSATPVIGNILFNSQTDATGNVISGHDPNKTTVIFAEAISNLSIGVSGCVSINYIYRFLKVMGL